MTRKFKLPHTRNNFVDHNRNCRHRRKSRDGADTEELPPQINLLVRVKVMDEVFFRQGCEAPAPGSQSTVLFSKKVKTRLRDPHTVVGDELTQPSLYQGLYRPLG